MNESVTVTEFQENIVDATCLFVESSSLSNVIISKDTRLLVETICYAGLTTLLCVVGLPSNVVSGLVFWCQGLKDRMNLCLFSMAAVDGTFLMCNFTIYSVCSFVHFHDDLLGEECNVKTVNALVGLADGLRAMSGFITVIIALDRCFCVSFPLHSSSLMKTSSMAALIFLCSLVCFGWYFTYSFMHTPTLVQSTNITEWIFVPTQFFEENKTLVGILGNTVFGTLVPISTLIILSATTVITILKLRSALKWRLSHYW